jgi:aspartate kinase
MDRNRSEKSRTIYGPHFACTHSTPRKLSAVSVLVQKFGGTSVANAEKIRNAAQRAVAARQKGHDVVVVVSARGHKTDELIDLAREITPNPRPRELDMLLSTGEQESVALMAMAVHELGAEAISLTGAQIGVRTDTTHTKARIVSISTERMRELLADGQIVIAAGFQGVDDGMNITTLGRGGSDTTAAALAAVLQAEQCEIYTDVEGVFTTDPRVVKSARKVERISYDEMLELASLGAGVMHSRSIEFAKKYSVPLRVRPSYSDAPGTLIAPDSGMATTVVTGIAFVRSEILISLTGLPDQPGVISSLFTALSAAKVPVDMVVQNVAREGVANVSFTVAEDDLQAALKVAQTISAQMQAADVRHSVGLSKVSIVGHGMQTHTGVAARMFRLLAESGINIQVVTTSEIRVSVLIDSNRCTDAVEVIHRGFGLDQPTQPLPEVVAGPAMQPTSVAWQVLQRLPLSPPSLESPTSSLDWMAWKASSSVTFPSTQRNHASPSQNYPMTPELLRQSSHPSPRAEYWLTSLSRTPRVRDVQVSPSPFPSMTSIAHCCCSVKSSIDILRQSSVPTAISANSRFPELASAVTLTWDAESSTPLLSMQSMWK